MPLAVVFGVNGDGAESHARGVLPTRHAGDGGDPRIVPELNGGRFDGRAAARYNPGMCRNIRTLFNFEPPATDDEVRAAALQFVRKLSGFSKPSQANEDAFERAVDEVAAVARELMGSLVTSAAPHDRDDWIAKAKARSAARFAKTAPR